MKAGVLEWKSLWKHGTGYPILFGGCLGKLGWRQKCHIHMLVPWEGDELESASTVLWWIGQGKGEWRPYRFKISQLVPQHLGESKWTLWEPRSVFYRNLCSEHQLNIFDGNPGGLAGSWMGLRSESLYSSPASISVSCAPGDRLGTGPHFL